MKNRGGCVCLQTRLCYNLVLLIDLISPFKIRKLFSRWNFGLLGLVSHGYLISRSSEQIPEDGSPRSELFGALDILQAGIDSGNFITGQAALYWVEQFLPSATNASFPGCPVRKLYHYIVGIEIMFVITLFRRSVPMTNGVKSLPWDAKKSNAVVQRMLKLKYELR